MSERIFLSNDNVKLISNAVLQNLNISNISQDQRKNIVRQSINEMNKIYSSSLFSIILECAFRFMRSETVVEFTVAV